MKSLITPHQDKIFKERLLRRLKKAFQEGEEVWYQSKKCERTLGWVKCSDITDIHMPGLYILNYVIGRPPKK